ncbi:microfibril-associated glycoprotein 4-like [Rhinichthys klamathensis goyatoka]|uniref:microfibril-associated glycoprotein 4-like n=1 Tax=Rhinichthys klamathensis goyatoka TaxID=3034132 RepID=UPI0024B5F2AF|nr:microfibril-associated glycoprotein 4-like [Rhinichthys klamathensis goyatoka]
MAMTVFVAALLSVFTASVVCVADGFMPVDCSDLYKAGQKLSGIYSIYPGDVPVWVYCHMISDGKDEDNGGWTVIQRRMDGSVNFYRPWNQYKRGFGNVESEYWLGLENMYQLTRNRKYMLRVDLEDFEGRKGFAQYSSFSVDPESDGYRLGLLFSRVSRDQSYKRHVSGFTDGGAGDSLSGHNDQKFSTFDKDQDSYGNNCAKEYLGAFWYKFCHNANPNGVYLWGEDDTHFGIGVVWSSWKNYVVSMKSISMKIKRVS